MLSVIHAFDEIFHYEVIDFQMDGKGNIMVRCTIMRTKYKPTFDI